MVVLPKPSSDEREARGLRVIQERLDRMFATHVLGVDDGFEHLSDDRIQWLRDRIRKRMTYEDSLAFGQILGRTSWNSWNDLTDAVRGAIRSTLGMEFSKLVKLGYFPNIMEDPNSPKSRPKQYILKKKRSKKGAKSTKNKAKEEGQLKVPKSA